MEEEVTRVGIRVEVDQALCNGHALCWREHSGWFPLDDEGYNALAGKGEVAVAPEHEQAAREGAEWCPEGAIRLIGSA